MIRIRPQRRGMTLVEVVIATTILGVVVAMAFLLTNSAVLSFEEKVATAALQTKGEETLKSMEDNIGDAQVLQPNDVTENGNVFYNAQVCYQVPVTHVVDPKNPHNVQNTGFNQLFPVSAPITRQSRGVNGISAGPVTGDFYLMLSFGWRDDNRIIPDATGKMVPFQGPGLQMNQSDVPVGGVVLDSNSLTPDGYMSYRFIQDTNARVGQNGVFDEQKEGVDIDGDGLMTSKYAVGYIERSYWLMPAGTQNTGTLNGTGTLVPESVYILGSSNVLQPLPGDATGNAPDALKTNWIFKKNQSRLDVSLWLVSYNEERRIQRVTHCHTSVFLRNSAN